MFKRHYFYRLLFDNITALYIYFKLRAHHASSMSVTLSTPPYNANERLQAQL